LNWWKDQIKAHFLGSNVGLVWSMGIRGVGGEGSSFLSFFNFKIVVLVREEKKMDYGIVEYFLLFYFFVLFEC
jgi:hypothetical protein